MDATWKFARTYILTFLIRTPSNQVRLKKRVLFSVEGHISAVSYLIVCKLCGLLKVIWFSWYTSFEVTVLNNLISSDTVSNTSLVLEYFENHMILASVHRSEYWPRAKLGISWLGCACGSTVNQVRRRASDQPSNRPIALRIRPYF